MASYEFPCAAARDTLLNLRQRLRADDESLNNCFFPVDEIRQAFPLPEVKILLNCRCVQCCRDRDIFPGVDQQQERNRYANKLVERAIQLFALLIYIHHPLLIFGFLQRGTNLSRQPSDYHRENLRDVYWKAYHRKFPHQLENVITEFETHKFRFFVPKLDKTYQRYPKDTILPFVDEERWGEGSYGTVWKVRIPEYYARDLFEDGERTTHFARKEMRVSSGKAFWREAGGLQLLQTLTNQEHVVRLIKPFKLGNSYNLLFPFAKGNLEQFLENRANHVFDGVPVEENPLWKQLLGIVEALGRLHKGVQDSSGESEGSWTGCHSDLKPANILISQDDQWQIADFGLATFQNQGRTRDVSSSQLSQYDDAHAYAPPEVSQVGARPSPSYDVWSMGCIMLEVTAFIVLGPEGHDYLNRARVAQSYGTSRWDYRLWQRATDGSFVVKPKIERFMQDIPASVRDQTIRPFVERLLIIISKMLEPHAEDRIEIEIAASDLQFTLESAGRRRHVTPQRPPTSNGEHQSEHQAELGSMMIYHLESKLSERQGTTESVSLHLFEPSSETIRLVLAASLQRYHPNPFKRADFAFVPVYAFKPHVDAFRSRLHFYLSPKYDDELGESHMLKGLQFAVIPAGATLPGAMIAQSAFTGQTVSHNRSFELSGFTLRKQKTLTRLFDKVKSKMQPSSNGKFEAELSSQSSLGTITAQIWVEYGSTWQDAEARTPSMTRRAVVFMPEGHIFIVRLQREMRTIKPEKGKKNVQFVPKKPEQVPAIRVAFLRASETNPNGLQKGVPYAGIPLDSNVLKTLEESSEMRCESVELTFKETIDAQNFANMFLDQVFYEREERHGIRRCYYDIDHGVSKLRTHAGKSNSRAKSIDEPFPGGFH